MTRESVYIKQHKQVVEGVIHKGMATAGGANTLTDDNIPDSNITDIWNDETLYIFSGTGAGQSKKIQTYDQPTHTLTLYDNWIVQPDTTSRYQVVVGTGISGGTAGNATAANQTLILAGVGTVDGKVDATIADQALILGRHEVPAADAATNTLLRDVIGNKSDDAVGAPTDTASLIGYMKAMLGAGLVDGIKNVGLNRDLPYLTEFFEDEIITPTIWDETLTNTGAISVAIEAGYKFARLSTGATAVSTAVLNSDQRFEFRPNTFNLITGVITRIVLEWDMRITNATNILNSSFIAGFADAKNSIRTSQNIAAFCLVADTLNTITDDSGTVRLTDVSAGITLSNWNKYRITAIPGDTVQFYINDSLVATHNVPAEVPDAAMYIVAHNANDAAADADVDIAHIRQWYSE